MFWSRFALFWFIISILDVLNRPVKSEIRNIGRHSMAKSGGVEKMKNYSGWRTVRVYVPESQQNPGDVLKILRSKDDVIVLAMKMMHEQLQIDLALGPKVKLNQVLSQARFPRTRCLDDANEGSQQPQHPERTLCWRTLDDNLQKSLLLTTRQEARVTNDTFSWDDYYSYDSIVEFCKGLEENYSTVKYVNIGKTFEGRELFALIFSIRAKSMANKYKREVLKMKREKREVKNKGTVKKKKKQSNQPKNKFKKSYKTKNVRAREERLHFDKVFNARRIQTLKKKKRPKKNKFSVGRKKVKEEYKAKRKKGKVISPRKTRLRKGRNQTGKDINSVKYKKKTKKKNAKNTRNKKNNNKKKKKKKIMKENQKKKNIKKKASIPIILIDAGMHAREWISPSVATYLAQQLADSGRSFLREVTVILVPMANPDGYEYSRTVDRLWRKNRNKTTLEDTFGVDLNRNWEVGWDVADGSSNLPHDEIYRGTVPFSEAESQAIRDLALVHLGELQLYLSLHSYGQLLLSPWGYTKDVHPNYKESKAMAKKITRSLNDNGGNYTHGQASHVLYIASGTSGDYMYSIGVPYSFILELPYDSFYLPAEEILPVSQQVWAALVCTVGHVAKTKKSKSFCDKELVKKKKKENRSKNEAFWVKKRL